MLPIVLAVQILMFLNAKIAQIYMTVPDIFLDFTNDVDSEDILGTLHITDLNITGLESITSDISRIKVSDEDEFGNNDVCISVPIGYLQLTADYIADIGIANEIPIYGDGRLLFHMTDIELNACAYFNFVANHVEDVATKFTYRHKPIEFTGFLKNEEVSIILENILNIANVFLAMWSAYEPEGAGCLLTPFLEYGVNNKMGTEDNTLMLNNTCLQELFTKNIYLSDYEHLKPSLMTLMETQNADDILNILNDDDMKSTVSEFVNRLLQNIRRRINKDQS